VPFEVVVSAAHGYYMSIEIATQSTLAADGSLAQSVPTDYFSAGEGNGLTTFRGYSNYASSGAWWASTPGTYYWQIHARYLSVVPFESHEYLSPVYTLTVAPAVGPSAPPAETTPPAASNPTMTIAEAYAAVKEIIRHKTGHSARHLSDKCHRTSQSAAACNASWSTSVNMSPSTVLYAGSFRLWREPQGNFVAFVGLRERAVCAKHFGTRRCASKVSWG